MNETQKQQCRDYVMLMLGAPVISLPIGVEEVDKMIVLANQYLESIESQAPKEYDEAQRICVLREGALLHAEDYLDKVSTLHNDTLSLDFKRYRVQNAKKRLQDWKDRVIDALYYDEEAYMHVLTLLLQRPDVNPEDVVSWTEDIMAEAGF